MSFDVQHREDSRLNLINLPWDIRHLIYTRLFSNLCLTIADDGDLDLSLYPWQICAVCHLLRNETLPYLCNTTPTSTLSLVCPDGRFPPSVRARLPTRIFHSIRYITILRNLYHDELRPSLRTFPNLKTLTFDLCYEGFPDLTWFESTFAEQRNSTSKVAISLLVRRALFWLHFEQTLPREGLEKDYLPEMTLWDVVYGDRRRRGFDVRGWVRCRERDRAAGEENFVMVDWSVRETDLTTM